MLTVTICCTLWYFFLPLINPRRPHSTIPSYKIDSCDVPSGFPNSLNCETLDQYLSDFNMHAKSWGILFNMQSLGWSVSGVKRRLSKHGALPSTPRRNQTATIKSPPPFYPSWLMTPLLSKPDCLLWKLFLSPKDVKPKVLPCEQYTTEKEKKKKTTTILSMKQTNHHAEDVLESGHVVKPRKRTTWNWWNLYC